MMRINSAKIRPFLLLLLTLMLVLGGGTGKSGAFPFAIRGLSGETAAEAAPINRTVIYLVEGQEEKLDVEGSSVHSWKSSDPSIASVDKNGVVRAKKKGTAVISAKTKTSAYYCEIRVEAPKISRENWTGAVGEKIKLSVKDTEQKVSWASSSPEIASVSDDGTVKARKAGDATISAALECGKVYFCNVTVRAGADAVRDLRVRESGFTTYSFSKGYCFINFAVRVYNPNAGRTFSPETEYVYTAYDKNGKVLSTGTETTDIVIPPKTFGYVMNEAFAACGPKDVKRVEITFDEKDYDFVKGTVRKEYRRKLSDYSFRDKKVLSGANETVFTGTVRPYVPCVAIIFLDAKGRIRGGTYMQTAGGTYRISVGKVMIDSIKHYSYKMVPYYTRSY